MKNNKDLYQQAVELAKAKKFAKALAKLSKLDNNNFEVCKLKMELLLALKKYHQVLSLGAILINAKNLGSKACFPLYLMALAEQKLGQLASAAELLEKSQAINATIDNAQGIYELLAIYARLEWFVKLEALAPRLLRWTAYSHRTLFILIQCAEKKADKKSLNDRITSFLSFRDNFNEAEFNAVSNYLYSLNRLDELESLIAFYEAKHNVKAVSLHAQVLLKKGLYKEANEYLLLAGVERLNHSQLYYVNAQILDKLGDFDGAYKSFSRGAALKAREFSQLKFTSHLPAYNQVIAKWDKTELLDFIDEVPIVFIFGFPRSGTTLLDNIMDTQDDILVLSERNTLANLSTVFSKLKRKYPNDIGKLTCDEISQLRMAYFALITNQGYSIKGKKLIVDKGPHHTEALPLLTRLFPNAKFIMTIRHPLDVCLSCFQQNFEFNEYNGFLTSMESIVSRYKQVFLLYEKYKKTLDLDLIEVKYESLVLDFEDQIDILSSFLSYKFEGSYKTFHKHAATKYITSASRGQTDKALYTTAIYKWKNYSEQLEEFKPILAEVITKYGYSA